MEIDARRNHLNPSIAACIGEIQLKSESHSKRNRRIPRYGLGHSLGSPLESHLVVLEYKVLPIVNVERSNASLATGGETCESRLGRRTSSVDNDGRRNREMHPANQVPRGGAHGGVEALAEGCPRRSFELDRGSVNP
jgi:hypothetical protein